MSEQMRLKNNSPAQIHEYFRNMKKILGLVVLFCVSSCRFPAVENNIDLTDFTKDLVSLYLNDEQNVEERNNEDDIILVSISDSATYELSVFSNNPKEFDYCRDDYLGQTIYLGHSITVYGDTNSEFFLLNKKGEGSKRCEPSYEEYDPLVWDICFDKDYTLCEKKTCKVSPYDDITVIRSLVERHFPAHRPDCP